MSPPTAMGLPPTGLPNATGLPTAIDVVIAGGGPAGLAAALELDRHGVSALVLEPRRHVSPARPRAKTTNARTMEHLRRWGLADRVREVAPLPVAWSSDAAFVTALLGAEITRFTDCFGLYPHRVDEVAESGQQIAQPLLESVFREAVQCSPGPTLATGWSLAGLQEGDDDVLVEARGDDGATVAVRARYVLGCDGSRGRTREAIGARYIGQTSTRSNYNVVFRAPGLLQRVRLAPAVHYWVLNHDVPGLLGPLDLADTWWGMAMGVDAATGDADPVRLVRGLLGADAHDLDIEVVATDPWTAQMQLADTYGRGRVHLVGDAAHLNPPFGGHGFNTCVGDAVNIGWKLAAVLRGWGGPELLASYEAERRPVAQQTIDEATTNNATLSGDLADPELGGPGAAGVAARDRVARRVQATKEAEFHSLGLVLGYSYDHSPVIAADPVDDPGGPSTWDPRRYTPSTRPGGRLPHTWLSDGRSLYDLLGPAMTVLVLRAGADPGPLRTAADRLGVPLAVVDATALTLPGSRGETLLLIRPDQHIAWGSIDPAPTPVAAEDALRLSLGMDRTAAGDRGGDI